MRSNNKQKMNNKLRSQEGIRPMTSEELALAQKAYLQMAKDVFSICHKNNITIMLSGGSVLGAIRHKGFIPWDDDMDINIPRDDYEKLKTIFDQEFGGKYLLYAPNYYRESNYRIARIENPIVDIEDANGHHHGLEIDIFVIENVPDSILMRLIKGSVSYSLMAIAAYVGEYERLGSELKGPKGIIGRIMAFSSSSTWNNRVDTWNNYHNNNTKFVGIPTGRNHYFGEIYNREALMVTKNIDFEGEVFNIPEGYDEYLEKLYGDYMVIPPEDKREHHYIKGIRFKAR